jgi:transposase
MGRKRRTFTEEFKRESAQLAVSCDRPISQVAEELGVRESVLRRWIALYKDRGGEAGLSGSEREELIRLRKETARLRMERDILKKATAFFVREQS